MSNHITTELVWRIAEAIVYADRMARTNQGGGK